MNKLLVLLAFLILFSYSLAVIPTMYDYNPAFVFESPRRYLNLSDFGVSLDFGNNFITFDDINKLAAGTKVVFDATRLSLMGDEGLTVLTNIYGNDYIGIGIGDFRLGVNLRTANQISMNLPIDLMKVIFGNVDFDATFNEDFSLFEGNILFQTGALLGYGFNIGKVRLNLALETGSYMPFISFDRNSKINFYYISDVNTATIQTGLKGDQKFYSAFPSLNSSEIDENLQSNMMGYYANVGASISMSILGNPAIFALAFRNISILPAKAKYYGYASVSFEASMVNLKVNITDPKVEFPENGLEELEDATDITVPYEINAFASYRLSIFDLAIYGKFIPELNLSEFGSYVSLWKILWINVCNLNSLWKKEIGLNIDLRVLRLTATLGVIDAGGLFNFDQSKMTGLSVSLGAGLGF